MLASTATPTYASDDTRGKSRHAFTRGPHPHTAAQEKRPAAIQRPVMIACRVMADKRHAEWLIAAKGMSASPEDGRMNKAVVRAAQKAK
jgi:hypothetical protein